MKSFTLIELVVVLVIIGVLATLGIAPYNMYRENALDREAEGNLALIIAAEKVYRMERQAFYIEASEALLNTNLRLFLPVTNMNWDYFTTQSAAALPVCCAQATRAGRNWRLCTNGNEPVKGACGANAANCP
jgi:prepilin-type N-terminal cleavage/methylation domain-containing protein